MDVVHEEERETEEVDAEVECRRGEDVSGGLEQAHHRAGEHEAEAAKEDAEDQEADE